MEIKEIKNNGEIILKVEGRVDTNTAPLLQAEILKAFQKCKHVSLDMKEVPYVSSAGLRVFLMAHKTAMSKDGEFWMCNVNEEIMSVLEMSGFTNFLQIH